MKDEEVDYLIRFITSSRYARYLTYRELALHLDLGYSQWAIRSALLSRGYRRYIAQRKPPLSPENQQKRLLWAQEHLNWSPSQWEAILWTDETWVNPGHHTRTWVTRRKDEVFHEDCTVLLNSAHVRSDGCFGAHFMELLKALWYSGRRNGVQLMLKAIFNI